MSFIVQYTTDSLGFVPRLWQIWRDEKRGTLRCIRVEKLPKVRATITAEVLPRNWRCK